jgi:hypothetical protein
MANMKSKGKKTGKGKKKYVKPKVTGHGSLQSIAERVTGVISLCCLTERARAALRSPAERRKLTRDLSFAVLSR